jgi:hypothetical protein
VGEQRRVRALLCWVRPEGSSHGDSTKMIFVNLHVWEAMWMDAAAIPHAD